MLSKLATPSPERINPNLIVAVFSGIRVLIERSFHISVVSVIIELDKSRRSTLFRSSNLTPITTFPASELGMNLTFAEIEMSVIFLSRMFKICIAVPGAFL